MISMVSKFFDLILLGFFRYLGFLFSGAFLAISTSLNLFSVSINKILNLCLLESLFQRDLSFKVSSGLSLLFNFVFIRLGNHSMDAWGFVVVWVVFLFGLGWVGGGVFSFVSLRLGFFLWIGFNEGFCCQVGQAFS